MTTRIHLRSSTLTAVSLLLATASLWQPTAAQAAPYIYFGALATTDPTFNRPLEDGSALSFTGTNVFYDVQPFFLTLASAVSLSVSSATFSPIPADDSFLALYRGSFNPASPLTNLIAANDDGGVGAPSAIEAIPLLANTNYFLVTTSFLNGVTGTYNDTIAPVNGLSVVVPNVVPESSTWAMALGGLGVLGLVHHRRTRRTA